MDSIDIFTQLFRTNYFVTQTNCYQIATLGVYALEILTF